MRVMILTIFLAVLALATQGAIYYFGGLYQNWYWFWTWIVFTVAFYWIYFGLFIVYLFICSLFMSLSKDQGVRKLDPLAMRTAAGTAHQVLMLLRCKLIVKGMEKVPTDRRFMLINNHLSVFDEFALLHLFCRYNVRYVTKPGNLKIPVAGQWLKRAGCIPIIQGDMKNGKEVIDYCAEQIKSGEASICIAPEGTRNKTFPEPNFLPFHPGTFNLAIAAKCPIVVVLITNTHAIIHRYPLHRSKIYIDVVDVIEPERYEGKTSNEIAEMCRNLMIKKFEEMDMRLYHLDAKK